MKNELNVFVNAKNRGMIRKDDTVLGNNFGSEMMLPLTSVYCISVSA